MTLGAYANPADDLLNRIDKGAAAKFKTILVKSDKDFFEIDQAGNGKNATASKPAGKNNPIIIRGNSWVNIAVGINWYLKHHAGIHITWNNMSPKLPNVLPAVKQKERHKPISSFATISITAPFLIRWLSGTGTDGRKKSTGWHYMASICHWLPWARNAYGATCF